MKKHILLVLLIFLALITGCDRGEEAAMKYKQFCGINVNNSTDLYSPKLKRYSLSQLNEYFGEYSAQELVVYNINSDNRDCSIESVNKNLPIQIMRYNQKCYYSIYPVLEGGFFYVFWDRNDDGATVSDTFYIAKLKNENDFTCLEVNKSSYEDVFRIDQASELILFLSNGVYSYHLLENNELLIIKYSFKDITNRSDLVIQSKNIVSTEEKNCSFLQSILYNDLPR